MELLIKVKYLSPTNHRGTRLKAICNQLTKTYSYDYSLEISDNLRQSAMQLWLDLRKLNPHMLPPVSAQVFILKDEYFVLVKDCEE